MTKQNLLSWILLMGLTITAGLLSSASVTYLVPIVLLLASVKFAGVAFGFMDMKKANPFWKMLIVGYLILFGGIMLAVLAG